MKAVLCLLIFSVAIAIISAEYNYEEEDEDEDDYELAAQEDAELSPLQAMDGLDALQDDLTVDKRGKKGRKGKGKKGKGRKGRKNRKGLKQEEGAEEELPVKSKSKNKVGPCWNNFGARPVFCAVCNYKRPETDMHRYLICGGGAKTGVGRDEDEE